MGNFASLSRQPLKATAYVSPTIKGSSSTSLLLGKASSTARSGLPRPASFVGTTSSAPRSKAAQSARR